MMYLYSARLDNALSRSHVRNVEIKRIELPQSPCKGDSQPWYSNLVSSKPTLEYNKLTVIINTIFAIIIDITVFSFSNQCLTYELLTSTTACT